MEGKKAAVFFKPFFDQDGIRLDLEIGPVPKGEGQFAILPDTGDPCVDLFSRSQRAEKLLLWDQGGIAVIDSDKGAQGVAYLIDNTGYQSFLLIRRIGFQI